MSVPSQFSDRTLSIASDPRQLKEVGFRYHGNRRTLGTYDSQDHAALANEVGRKMLMADKEKSSKLTAEEVERNMKQARNAAFKAVSNIQEDIPPNEEDMFNLILMVDEVASMESGERPNLALSRSQPKKVSVLYCPLFLLYFADISVSNIFTLDIWCMAFR